MKIDNPWIIIRWALVIVIYVATLAIAIDQLRDRDKQIAELETWKTDTRKVLNNVSSGIDQEMASSQQVASGLEAVKTSLIDQQANLAKSEKLQELLALTAQRLQKQAEGKILTDKLAKNIAAGDALKAKGKDLIANGATKAEGATFKTEGQNVTVTARDLVAQFEVWKQELAQIDERRKVLQEECDQIPEYRKLKP